MKNRKIYKFLIILWLCFCSNNLCFGLGNYSLAAKRDMGLSKKNLPIAEEYKFVLNNLITQDKKFACLEIDIVWTIKNLSKPIIIFNEEKELIEHVDGYLKMKCLFAASSAVINVESNNFDKKINEIQAIILNTVKNKFVLNIIERTDIEIEDITIVRYVILDSKYEGEDFPGATIRVEKGKTAKIYVKEKFGSPDRIKKTDDKEIWYYDDFEVIVDKSRGVEKFTYIVEYDSDGIVSRDFLYKE